MENFMTADAEYVHPGEKLFALLSQFDDTIQWYQRQGFDGFSKMTQREQTQAIATPEPSTLKQLEQALQNCQRCKLHHGRTHVVFGTGNPQAILMFIGEGPGYHEDQQGVPFVGEAGELLTKIIHAINLTRDDVYIANIVKCRPPHNRDPEPDEIATCFPFLQQQITMIRPQIICTLGKVASQALLQTADSMSKLRGRFYDYHGIQVMPTFHPAYLLRNPEDKRLTWEDMKLVKHAYAQYAPMAEAEKAR
ncbi:hypothetical protein U14_04636 [Candidatus Moduliflexus flocculans]|uniref:Type-4 uracil-DNA glycosylase n=1 Tax=Candidatus Moduliflexus flocculans TaxID=1499966 RepID=A0A0S6W4F7_9BACT|nr:hypothetical protein U14_04636 [Candidatus Moduliflexus flocculans]